MEIAMGEVAQFPEVQHFLICHECDGTEWFICWPKDKRPEWYIECAGCNSQFKQSVLTKATNP